MAGLLDRGPLLGETDGEAIIHDTGFSGKYKKWKNVELYNVIREFTNFGSFGTQRQFDLWILKLF